MPDSKTGSPKPFQHVLGNLRGSAKAIGWPLFALLVFSLLAILAAYQSRPGYAVNIGCPADSPFVQGFFAREQANGGTFRWTAGESAILLPEVGSGYRLTLVMNGGRPDGTLPLVSLKLNGEPLAELHPASGMHAYQYDVGTPALHQGPAVLQITSETFQPQGDQRDLGVMIESVKVEATPALGPLVLPPASHLILLLFAVALLYLSGERLGLGRIWPLAAGGLAIGAAVLVLVDPISAAGNYETIFLAGLLIYIFTLLVRARAYVATIALMTALLFLGVGFSAPSGLFYGIAGFLLLVTLWRARGGYWDNGLAIVVALSTFAIVPLFQQGVVLNSDQPIHLYWISELDKLFEQGVFYSRWAPDQGYGWGGPVFNFYAPLSWYTAEGFHLAGMSLVQSLKATMAVGILAGMAGMYLFARELMGRVGAVIASVAFGYFPYFLADINIRGEVSEALAIGLLPSILWALQRLVAGHRLVFLPIVGVLYALLMLCHNVTALFATPFLLAYVTFAALRTGPSLPLSERIKALVIRFAHGGSGLILGLGLSAFFWVPAVLEKQYIWGGLPPLSDANPWGFQAYYMPFEWLYSLHLGDLYLENGHHHPVGVYFYLAAASIIALVAWYRRDWWRTVFPFFALLLPVLVFLQTPASEWFWKSVPLAGFIQYPWRLLDLTGICIALLLGGAGAVSLERIARWKPAGQFSWPGMIPPAAVTLGLIVASVLPLQPLFDQRDINYNDPSANLADARDMRMKGQFLPVWVKPDSLKPRDTSQPIGMSSQSRLTVLSASLQKVGHAEWQVQLRRKGPVTFQVNYFPGWQVYVDGQPAETFPNSANGRVAANLPAGEHDVILRLEPTLVQRVSEYLSIASLAALVAVLVLFFKPRQQSVRAKAGAELVPARQ